MKHPSPREEDDAAAVIAVILALRSSGPEPTDDERLWGGPAFDPRWAPGPAAWWSSGLPR